MITAIRTQAFVKMVRKYNLKFGINAYNAFSEDQIGKKPYSEKIQGTPLTEFQALHLFKRRRVLLHKNNFVISREIVDHALSKGYVELEEIAGSKELFMKVTFEGCLITDKPFGLLSVILDHYGPVLTFITGAFSLAALVWIGRFILNSPLLHDILKHIIN